MLARMYNFNVSLGPITYVISTNLEYVGRIRALRIASNKQNYGKNQPGSQRGPCRSTPWPWWSRHAGDGPWHPNGTQRWGLPMNAWGGRCSWKSSTWSGCFGTLWQVPHEALNMKWFFFMSDSLCLNQSFQTLSCGHTRQSATIHRVREFIHVDTYNSITGTTAGNHTLSISLHVSITEAIQPTLPFEPWYFCTIATWWKAQKQRSLSEVAVWKRGVGWLQV